MVQLKRILLCAFFVSINVSLGLLLAVLPNIELLTVGVVFSGLVLGRKYGLLIGILSFAGYSVLSPYGSPPLIVLISQAFGGGFIGFFGTVILKNNKKILIYGLSGFFLTLFYDLMTSIGFFFAFQTAVPFFVYLVSGILFSLNHVISNSVLFVVILPVLVSSVKFYRMNIENND